jgi:hypothetical protein
MSALPESAIRGPFCGPIPMSNISLELFDVVKIYQGFSAIGWQKTDHILAKITGM